MPINIVKVKKNGTAEESVTTESIATDSKITDSTITESSSDKSQKKTKTQAQKKEPKSIESIPIVEQKELNQEEIKLNPEILPETEIKDSGKKETKTKAKKKELKSVELASISEKMEEINLNQETPSESFLSETVPIVESQPAKTKKKTKKAKVSSEAPENQPEDPNPEEAEQTSPFFQAFGLVQGKIREQESFYVLQIGEQTHSLWLKGASHKLCQA